jgi:predicted nucleotidyltransferase
VDLTEKLLTSIRQIAASHVAIRALYVFGSQSAGGARPDSDTDLGVLYRSRQPIETTFLIEEELQRVTGKKIDLVDVARARAFLALEIIRGERIFCRESAETDRFELYVLRRAGDLLPFERRRQELLLAPTR